MLKTMTASIAFAARGPTSARNTRSYRGFQSPGGLIPCAAAFEAVKQRPGRIVTPPHPDHAANGHSTPESL